MGGRFAGKVALVTGAARGMGRSHALGFAREGADVVINDVCREIPSAPIPMGRRDELENLADEIRQMGVRALPIIADVSKGSEVKDMVEKAVNTFGRIDILVNNAGIASVAKVVDMSEEMWDMVINVNLKGAFLCSKYVAPFMIKNRYGRIINISSTEGLVGTPGMAHYVASKHGLIGLTKVLAQELAPYWITVNAVCPGDVGTAAFHMYSKAYPGFAEEISRLQGAYSLFPGYEDFEKPLLEPQDITNVVLWLASDEARYITGTAIVVDGGFTSK
ncbi:(-)-trans-carveol dehydrogenase [archaeon HR01]|nr:(-)-trans-carveol dehydrogenase [archaeon HR01]